MQFFINGAISLLTFFPFLIFAGETSQQISTQQSFKLLVDVRVTDGIYYPQNISELQSLIDLAKSNQLTVRVVGAHHSANPAIFGLDKRHEIRINLDGDFRKIISIEPDISNDFAIVRVGAGCNLGVNPSDPRSTLENSFNYQINEAGFALPTLGGISHQTIAGFLQTSSSGGSVQHGVADVILAIDWIDGNGTIHHAQKGEDAFNAVVVSMGLFGVVTEVTFKAQKKYLVEGTETNHEMIDSYLAKDSNGLHTKLHNALFLENEYIHINWLPQKFVDRTIQWIGKSVPFNATLPIVPYKHALNSKVIASLATAVFCVGNTIDRYASCYDLFLRFKALLFKPFANPSKKKEFREIWYKALPIDDQADVDGVIKTYFSEMWFPEEQMEVVVKRLEELFIENPKAAGNFIVELYAAKESPLWLSPAYGHNAFRVDLYWWTGNKGDHNQYFGIFWEKLLDVPGARFHWGKYLPIPGIKYGDKVFAPQQLLQNYPKFEDWLRLREKMDPQQIFVTDYWRGIFTIPLPNHQIFRAQELND